MKTIWKYQIEVNDSFTLKLPAGAKVLAVQMQGPSPQMWVLVDPEAAQEERYFAVHGTGHPLPADGRSYVGTFQLQHGALVFHLFECPTKPRRVP